MKITHHPNHKQSISQEVDTMFMQEYHTMIFERTINMTTNNLDTIINVYYKDTEYLDISKINPHHLDQYNKNKIDVSFFLSKEVFTGKLSYAYLITDNVKLLEPIIRWLHLNAIKYRIILLNSDDEIVDELKSLRLISKALEPEVVNFQYATVVYPLGRKNFLKLNLFLKRCLDLVVAIPLFLILMPFFLILAIIIKLDSKGPVFYKPMRIGRLGKSFTMYKFRSMSKNDTSGLLSTKKNDPRITRIGKYIRKSNIDELPQLINVIKGDMSLVGPRPHRTYLNALMREEVPDYMLRYYVKPGITGWAQAHGWRGPTETDEQKIQRTNYDMYYVKNFSFFLDLKIILLTAFSKKSRKNAF
jgi:lipopolysaccharide/colanic/teichoic acid biosynthesis glycosyltransferase